MRFTIRQKLSLVFVLLILLPAFVLGLSTLRVVRRSMTKQVEQQQLLLLESIKTNIVDRHVDDMEKALRALSGTPELLHVFEDRRAREKVLGQWELVRAVFPERSWIYFGTEDNRIIVSPTWKPPQDYDCRTRPWYEEARYAGGVVWVEPYPEYITSDIMMSASVPIYDETRRFRGVLSVDTHMEAFLALLRQAAGTLSPQIAAVYPSGAALMLNRKETGLLDMASLPRWEEIGAARGSGAYLEYDGTTYYATFVDVRKLEMKLVSLLPVEAVNEHISPIQWTVLSVSLFTIGASLLAGLYLSRHFVRNIERLNQYIGAVESGDYRIRYCVSGKDEFYQLNAGLNTMVHHLAENIRSLQEESNTDPLCRINNRRYLLDRLEDFCAGGAELSVILMDVDHFKEVNDSFGHTAGDEVLRRIAGLMRRAFPESSVVGRYGGEEFVALLPGRSAVEATMVAERFRATVESQSWRENGLVVTLSAGVSTKHPGDGPAVLIDRADRALYRAKREGRNRVVCGEAGAARLV